MRFTAEWTFEGNRFETTPFEDREDARNKVNAVVADGASDAFVREVLEPSDTKLQSKVVRYMVCDMMQNTEDWADYRQEMYEVEGEIADALGEDWAEHTADWATGCKMTSMEIVLWPVENWDHFIKVARGELAE